MDGAPEDTTAALPRWRRWLMPATLVAGVAAVLAIWLLPGGFGFIVYSEQELAQIPDIHDYHGKPVCQVCHDGEGLLVADHNKLCTGSCHTFEQGNHPVNVAQRDPVDPGLPLARGNLVVCTTCHDPHSLAAQKDGLRLPFSELCLRCHVNHGAPSARAAGAHP